MRKIRKGDDVIVITGKDKGRRGNVLQIIEDKRVVVEGINLVKKHVKPNPMQGEQGGIREMEKSVAISNVAIYNAVTGQADRVGFRVLEDGRKVRYFKSNGEVIDA